MIEYLDREFLGQEGGCNNGPAHRKLALLVGKEQELNNEQERQYRQDRRK